MALRCGFVEGGQVAGVGVGQRLAGVSGGFSLVLLAQRFEALFQYAAQRLGDNVAGDEGGGMDSALLLATVAN
jgi:hypothetical protein